MLYVVLLYTNTIVFFELRLSYINYSESKKYAEGVFFQDPRLNLNVILRNGNDFLFYYVCFPSIRFLKTTLGDFCVSLPPCVSLECVIGSDRMMSLIS